jgi:hypothetical protein
MHGKAVSFYLIIVGVSMEQVLSTAKLTEVFRRRVIKLFIDRGLLGRVKSSR